MGTDKQDEKHVMAPGMVAKQWKPGQSGNPKGRKTNDKCLTVLLRGAGNAPLPDDEALPAVWQRAMDLVRAIWGIPKDKQGKPRHYTVDEFTVYKWRLDALSSDRAREAMMDRLEGRVAQELAVSDTGSLRGLVLVVGDDRVPITADAEIVDAEPGGNGRKPKSRKRLSGPRKSKDNGGEK